MKLFPCDDLFLLLKIFMRATGRKLVPLQLTEDWNVTSRGSISFKTDGRTGVENKGALFASIAERVN
jgi:hypothetical protein